MKDDLISRSALLEKAINVTKYDEGGWGMDLKAVSVEDVLKATAVDAVEVVRCKNCKHFRRNLENDTYCGCVGGLSDPEEHDFCSYGERRGEE